ncbi:MAG: nucleotidyltransferase domain-containing protein [Chloroflexi bacterium]|nr:nucleotidyltransferase domain-containing protein [Chloroflexota bacterium]
MGNLTNAHLHRGLFGKTRQAVLALLYGQADRSFYTRQILDAVKTGRGTVQRELKSLAETGVIIREAQGKQVYYRANESSPIYPELKGIVAKTFGLADVLREALAPFNERIACAFVYGSTAKGEAVASSDIDLLVVGNADEMALHRALSGVEDRLARPVNYTLMNEAEFRQRSAENGGFLARVLSGPKIMILGRLDDLR